MLQLVLCLAGVRLLTLPLYVVMTLVAFPIGFVLSYVIMGTLFYVVIAPIGLLMRLFGHDPMDRRFRQDPKSY